jgi:hypothetical protein
MSETENGISGTDDTFDVYNNSTIRWAREEEVGGVCGHQHRIVLSVKYRQPVSRFRQFLGSSLTLISGAPALVRHAVMGQRARQGKKDESIRDEAR